MRKALLATVLTGNAAVATELPALLNIEVGETHIEAALVHGGTFLMGDAEGIGHSDERPAHKVDIETFYLSRTEITVGLFAVFSKATGYSIAEGCQVFTDRWSWDAGASWRDPLGSGSPVASNTPVVCVSWSDATAFIAWLREASGRAFFLPSEAQWEYAARGGSDERYAWGNEVEAGCRYGNIADQTLAPTYPNFDVVDCDDGFERLAPVGQFKSGAFDLFDMTGNAWEWVADCWNDRYDGAPSEGSAWLTGDCSRRVFRGGGWGDVAFFIRPTLRNRTSAANRKDDVGFRVALSR